MKTRSTVALCLQCVPHGVVQSANGTLGHAFGLIRPAASLTAPFGVGATKA